jgi:uncharacterized small protein (DUF1192 family)
MQRMTTAEMERLKAQALKKATLVVPYCDATVLLKNHMRTDARIKELQAERKRTESARRMRDSRFGGVNAYRGQRQSDRSHRDTQPRWIG